MTDITRELVRFAKETNLSDINDKVVQEVKKSILDTLGVTIAGRRTEVAEKIVDYVSNAKGIGNSSVLGESFKTIPSFAALANGTMGHALDFDDSNKLLNGHGSVTTFPASLALSEKNQSSGAQFIEAYLLGFEVASKLGSVLNMELYENGWHPTAVLGSVGSCVSSIHLTNLSADEACSALGIVSSQASGLRANFGTMTKPFHAGMAAESGVRSVELASLGMTSNQNIFEANSGYASVFSKLEKIQDGDFISSLGNPFCFESPGVDIKPYPCCMSSYNAIEGMFSIIKEERVKLEDVESIEVGLLESGFLNLSYHRPKTGLQAKFSVEYILSRVLKDENLTIKTFTDELVNDPLIQEFMGKIDVKVDNELEWEHPMPKPTLLKVATKNGKLYERTIYTARGKAEMPLSLEEVELKFRECVDGLLEIETTDKVINIVNDLDREKSIAPLMKALSGCNN
ncbi:MAG: MmgE/PrpD family protein [Nitrospinota bacterium]|nr:MmgE/PrpD family protein [Nitrospinota bacterium]